MGPTFPPIYGPPVSAAPTPSAPRVPQANLPQPILPQAFGAPRNATAPAPIFPALTQPFNPSAPIVRPPLQPPVYNPQALSNTQLSGSTISDVRGSGIPGQLSVTPHRIVAPVGEEVLLTAQICGVDGYMVTNQPIEWNLSPDSVGSIVEVDQNNKRLWRRLFGRPPYRRDGIFAKGLTSTIAQIIPRGLPGPQDDVTLSAGQTWTSVSSSIEGATQVTCVAPRLEGWENRRSTATIHWVDGQWNFPPPTISNTGSGTTLCTQLRRKSNAAPLAGWRVVYEIAGGAPATFDGGRTRTEATSDQSGRACVNIMPTSGQPGSTQVRMQVIKTGSSSTDPSMIPLGSGMTTVAWTHDGPSSAPGYQPPFRNVNPGMPNNLAPTPTDPENSATPPPIQLEPPGQENPIPDLSQPEPATPSPANPALPELAPTLQIVANGPATANVGQQVDYVFSVRNPDTSPAESVEVRTNVPEGMTFISAQPSDRVSVIGDQIIWRLDTLPPGQSRDVSVRYRVDRGGRYEQCAAAAWMKGGPIDDCVTTDVLVNGLSLDVRGDESALVGDRAQFTITVRNISNRPLTDVVIEDDYDDGLFHVKGPTPIRRKIGTLDPGKEFTQDVSFEVRGSGRLCQRVRITSDDGSLAEKQICLNSGSGSTGVPTFPPNRGTRPIIAGKQALQVQKIGPGELKVGDIETYKIQIINTGNVPLTDIQVFNDYDANLAPLRGSMGLQRDGNADRIYWRIPRIEVGQQVEIILVAEAMAPSPSACDHVTVLTREGVKETDDLCVKIFGINAGGNRINNQPPGGNDGSGPLYVPPAGVGTSTKRTVVAKPVGPTQEGIDVTITSMGADGIDQGNVTYYIQVTNVHDEPEQNVVLTIETPEGTEFQTAISPPKIRPARYASDKRTVEFLPISSLRVNETARFRVVAKRTEGKVGRFRAKVASDRIVNGPVFSDKTR